MIMMTMIDESVTKNCCTDRVEKDKKRTALKETKNTKQEEEEEVKIKQMTGD